MAAEDIVGIPDLPDIPSIPIFPSTELGVRPPLPGERRGDSIPGTRLEEDRLEVSSEGRAFNASRILFDRIAAEFKRRQADGEPWLPTLDANKVEEELLSQRSAEPNVAADTLLREIRDQARTFGAAAETKELRDFQQSAHAAFDTAFEGTRSELVETDQLDERTSRQLESTAQRVHEGIEALTTD